MNADVPPSYPWALVKRVDEGDVMRGPIFTDGGHITFELTPGMDIKGEWILQVCAGPDGARVLITKTCRQIGCVNRSAGG